MRDARYLDQPYEISVETLALCNAACTFCPYPTLERKGAKLSDVMMESILEQVSEWKHPFYFSPFKVNEPLLDKRVIPYLEQVNERAPKAMLRIFTNGSTLTTKNSLKIDALRKVQHLWISLNSVDPTDYFNLMRLEFYSTALRIDALHAMVKERMFRHLVVLSRVADGTDEDKAFVQYCQQRWPRFLCQLIKRDGWLGYVEPQFDKVPPTPCARWWELSITATGIASLCCMDGTGEYAVGNIHHSTLLDIYNQPTMYNRRAGLLQREGLTPCNRCTY